MSNPFIISMRLEANQIDYRVAGIDSQSVDRAIGLADFLTKELEKAGGQAVVAVDDMGFATDWVVPEISDQVDLQQVAYCSHLLQCGLLLDPTSVIAQTAYMGGIHTLSLNLLSINSSGRNSYLAERDAKTLALVAPKSVQALSMLGLILLENHNSIDAAWNFAEAQGLDPLDFLSAKYLSTSLIILQPAKSVILFEKCLQLLSLKGLTPDRHLRASYGMSLLSAGMKTEAAIQFLLACGHKKPGITPQQWVDGAYRITEAEIPLALAPKLKGKKKA